MALGVIKIFYNLNLLLFLILFRILFDRKLTWYLWKEGQRLVDYAYLASLYGILWMIFSTITIVLALSIVVTKRFIFKGALCSENNQIKDKSTMFLKVNLNSDFNIIPSRTNYYKAKTGDINVAFFKMVINWWFT